jgi:hypothetical protein
MVGEPPDDEADKAGSEVSSGSANEGEQRDPQQAVEVLTDEHGVSLGWTPYVRGG